MITARRGATARASNTLVAGASILVLGMVLSGGSAFAQAAPASPTPGADAPVATSNNAVPTNPPNDPAAAQLPGQHTNVPSTGAVPSTAISTSGDAAAEQEPHAQGTATTTNASGAVQEVVVTGFRNSLRNAITAKKNSDEIIESISAEDIGKLPDNSIAESIARLPGVTAQRLDGRDSVISIRGLSPDFTTTLLNGREQVSTGDNRSAEFDQYPAELISGVVVYKTMESGLVGQGLAGTVDLRTIRPLDYKTSLFSINARGEYDELNDKGTRTDEGYRVSATYIGQFLDNKLGVSLGIAREDSPNLSNRVNTYGEANFAPAAGQTGAAYPATNALVLGGDSALAYEGDLQRTGITATLQYRANSHFLSTLDLYYSDYKNTQLVHGIENGLADGSGILQPGSTSAGNLVNAATYSPVYSVVRNDDSDRQADLYAAGYNGVYDGGSWRVIGDISYSGVRRRDEILEEYAGTGRNLTGASDAIGYSQNSSNLLTFSHNLNYADPTLIKLTSPQGWGSDVVTGGQDGYLNRPLVQDDLEAYRLAFVKDFNEFGVKSVEIGGNFTHRTKSYTPDEYFLALNANLADPTHSTSVNVPSNLLESPLSLAFAGYGNVLTYDPRKALADGLYSYIKNPNADVATAAWKAREDVSLLWVKANIDQPLMGGTLTGNVGVQVDYADQSSTGLAASGAPITLRTSVTEGAKYVEPLPSLNLAWRMPDQTDVLRGAISREEARPRMDDMSASVNYTYAPTYATSTDLAHSPWSGSGGNPKLRPWIADSADLSLEHYFGRDAYVSASFYYKYLETYIYTQNELYNFTGVSYSGAAPLLNEGYVSTPVNGSGGNLYGLELTMVTPLPTLINMAGRFGVNAPKWVDGFGVSGSASYTESSIVDNGVAGGLPGLSRYVANGTFYYEKYGFSGRASVRYRSKYLAEVSGFGDSRTISQAESETIFDMQVGYQFQDGPLKNLGVLLQAENLTNEPFILYNNGDVRQVTSYQEYGRRFLFGVSYKY
ncbi:MAG: TonB-dependent receptor [Caulobacteraceae bacterium]